jgi:hypothetical protein
MSITLPRPPRGTDYPKDPCKWAINLEDWARVAGGLIEDESRLQLSLQSPQVITGRLSAVADPNTKAVLTSLIGALVKIGLVRDATT